MRQQLVQVAADMGAKGKGILAADESSGTIRKRFDGIGVESTEENRRDYRELLFRTSDALSECISGVILFDETLRQSAADGTPLVQLHLRCRIDSRGSRSTRGRMPSRGRRARR